MSLNDYNLSDPQFINTYLDNYHVPFAQMAEKGKVNTGGLERGDSLRGRIYCLGLLMFHTISTFTKPLETGAVLVLNIAVTPYSVATANNKLDELVNRFNLTTELCAWIVISTVSHGALAARAALGTLHPGAYFVAATPVETHYDLEVIYAHN